MKTIYIPEHHLRQTFHALTITDEAKVVLNNIITRFDQGYARFMHGIFSAYSKVHVSLMDEHCEASVEETRALLEKFLTLRREINPVNIFIADKFDLLYGVSCTGDTRNVKFKDFMYEDIYNRLENLYGADKASEHMEDIFESIEFVTGLIEGSLIALSQNANEDQGNITFYVDIHHEGLLFIII
jgi:hypothetical protein